MDFVCFVCYFLLPQSGKVVYPMVEIGRGTVEVVALVKEEFTKDKSGRSFKGEQCSHLIQPVHCKPALESYFSLLPIQVKKY